jgi:hypothetical protein
LRAQQLFQAPNLVDECDGVRPGGGFEGIELFVIFGGRPDPRESRQPFFNELKDFLQLILTIDSTAGFVRRSLVPERGGSRPCHGSGFGWIRHTRPVKRRTAA